MSNENNTINAPEPEDNVYLDENDKQVEDEPTAHKQIAQIKHEHNNFDQSSYQSMEELHPWHEISRKSWSAVQSYIKTPDEDWRFEKGTSLETGIVHSKKFPSGKVFRLQAVIDVAPRTLFEDMVFKPEEGANWNPVMKECEVVQVIDSSSDILYSIAHEIAGGLISSRDFLSIRNWGYDCGVHFVVGQSVEHPSKPPSSKHVRAINGPGGWVYESLKTDEEKCLFFWYMNTDMKGWFPRKLIDANIAKTQLDFVIHLQNHAAQLKTSDKE